MDNGFEMIYAGHESNARKLILKNKLKNDKELATMTSHEVEQTINANFEAIRAGDDWLLIPRDKMADFNEIATWITR